MLMPIVRSEARPWLLRLCAAAALALALLLTALPTAPSASAQAPVTAFTYVGVDGLTYENTDADSRISASLDSNGDLVFQFERDDETLFVELNFLVGDLPNNFYPELGARYYDEGRITDQINADTICVATPADFEILEIEIDELTFDTTTLALDFNHYCAGVRGSIRINSSIPLDTETSISGTVTAAAGGAVLPGVRVCAYGDATEPYCTNTDSDGNYLIKGFPEGIYVVDFLDLQGRGYAGECFPRLRRR